MLRSYRHRQSLPAPRCSQSWRRSSSRSTLGNLMLLLAGGLLGATLSYPLGRDQIVEPFHFALAGLQPQLVQLAGVAIKRTAGPCDRFAQTFSAFLDLTTAALEDPHPGFGRGAVEEGEMNAEPVVGVVLRTRVGHQLGETLLARVGELIHPACTAHLGVSVWRRILHDQPVGLHPAQCWIQRAVG